MLYSGSGITASANGSAVYTGGYAGADCYNTIDVGSAQTVTMIISHSVDAQNWVTGNTFTAVSADGTRVPYFVLHRRDMLLNGQNPTLLYAYGGFQVSNTPAYSPNVGKLWLDRRPRSTVHFPGTGTTDPERSRLWEWVAAAAR